MGIRKYIYAFIISLLILLLGVYIVGSLTESKIEKVRSLETGIAINILSLETQFALLQEVSCKDISQYILSDELEALAQKLQFMEKNLQADDPELLRLKKYYSLLEIKDFILMRKVKAKCGQDLHYILYFYSNDKKCKKCSLQGTALTKLLKERPNLRVYNFDYDMELSATETLKKIFSVKEPLPALVIDGKTFNKYLNLEALQDILPAPEQDEDAEAEESNDKNKKKDR